MAEGVAWARASWRAGPAGITGTSWKTRPKLLHDAANSGSQTRWLPSRLMPHHHRPRAELQPAHELQVDMLR
jgi:hypothetical protein